MGTGLENTTGLASTTDPNTRTDLNTGAQSTQTDPVADPSTRTDLNTGARNIRTDLAGNPNTITRGVPTTTATDHPQVLAPAPRVANVPRQARVKALQYRDRSLHHPVSRFRFQNPGPVPRCLPGLTIRLG